MNLFPCNISLDKYLFKVNINKTAKHVYQQWEITNQIDKQTKTLSKSRIGKLKDKYTLFFISNAFFQLSVNVA